MKLELTKAEKTGCLAGYQEGSGLRSGVIGSTVFHFIAFETKNSRLYFEEVGRPEEQLVIQLLLSRLQELFQLGTDH